MSNLLKFSHGKNNTKLAKLERLTGKKLYSFSLLSGVACPGAQSCLAKVVLENGSRKLEHGPAQKFTCFSAVEENAFTNVYKARKYNLDLLKACKSKQEMIDLIGKSLPNDAEIIRWHVAGDFFSQSYFDATLEIAKLNSKIVFYAYTKSLPFWVARLDVIPDNFILTASEGGRYDFMIAKHGLRKSVVVFSEEEAKQLNLELDFTDFMAYNPLAKEVNIGLLLHGRQKAGSQAAAAMKILNKKKKEKDNVDTVT